MVFVVFVAWCLLLAVCGVLFVLMFLRGVRCVLFGCAFVCRWLLACLLCVVCCLLRVGLCVVGCVWYVACRVFSSDMWYMLSCVVCVVCCLLFIAPRVFSVVCSSLLVVCCCLLNMFVGCYL